MDKRFAIFLALAFLAITANSLFVAWRRGGQENVAKQGEAIDAKGKQKADGKADAKGADLKDKEGKLPPGDAEKRAGVKPEDGAAAADPAEGAAKPGDEQAEDADKPADEEAEQAKPIAPQWVTLGSVDPDSPYRMLITATNRGAAIERVELSDPEYRDREDRNSGCAGPLGRYHRSVRRDHDRSR